MQIVRNAARIEIANRKICAWNERSEYPQCTPNEINALHASGTQFPLDSDEIDAALAAADLDPATCTPAEALTACQEFANAAQAFGQSPTRGGKRNGSGAPRGNSNGKKEIVKDFALVIRLSQEEYSTIAAATDGKISAWLREIALAAASKEIKND